MEHVPYTLRSTHDKEAYRALEKGVWMRFQKRRIEVKTIPAPFLTRRSWRDLTPISVKGATCL